MQDENGKWVLCCIKGCEAEVHSGGMCVGHHRRTQKYGSPVASKLAAWRWLRLSHEERFWIQVGKSDGCWLWLSGKDPDGYGGFSSEHEGVLYHRAHRYSYALHHGPIPDGMQVCHTCDEPSCVRPDHLFLGSIAANMADKMAKGRHRVLFGEKQPRAILTEEQAKAILNDPRPHGQIAMEYGVHVQTISSLKTRVSWPHLGKVRGVKAVRVSPRKGVSHKITPDIVRGIRASTQPGHVLAVRHGVSRQTITDIRKRRSWAHVTDD